MAGRIAALPEVAVADPIRLVNIQYDGQEVGIVSHDMDAYFAISPELLDSGDSDEARTTTARSEAMLVSNNFATRWNLRLGDVVTLDTPGGPLSLPIAGMLDYWRSEKGTIFFDRELFKKYWGDSDVDYIFLDLKPGVDRDALKAKIENALLGEQRAFIFTHDEYRIWVGHIVDQFFALVYVQMGIAFLVAVIGLVNTMVISVAERRRELGIFRAIGGLRRQVAKMVLLEAVAISIIGFLTGTLAGFFLALFLVNTAARVVGAFTLPLIFPLSMVLIAIPIVSAWFPARSASRLNVVDAIGYE
jgi:putative ABC transport system permease protein